MKYIKRLFVLFSIVFIGCAKGNDIIIVEFPLSNDTVENIIPYQTIECNIEYWYDNLDYAINFTWDDANSTHSLIDDVFRKYGYISTYFIQTSALKNSSICNRYKRISDRGNEIASHTVNHIFLDELSINKVEEELKNSSQDIYNSFGYYPATFAHPGSHYNKEIDRLVCKYYLSSRYSSILNTKDRFFWSFRTVQKQTQMIAKINEFMSNSKQKWMIYGGHGVNGEGYEPIEIEALDSLLHHIKMQYSEKIWVTTFANVVMYKFLRENLKIEYGVDFVFINRNNIQQYIEKFSNTQCVITLKFPDSENVEFTSSGIVKQRKVGKDQIISIDLRKSRIINFKR